MRYETSPLSRFQFSCEKAYTVSASTSHAAAHRVTVRSASTPLSWPAFTGSDRSCAQRALPSMMMARWRGRARDARLDKGAGAAASHDDDDGTSDATATAVTLAAEAPEPAAPEPPSRPEAPSPPSASPSAAARARHAARARRRTHALEARHLTPPAVDADAPPAVPRRGRAAAARNETCAPAHDPDDIPDARARPSAPRSGSRQIPKRSYRFGTVCRRGARRVGRVSPRGNLTHNRDCQWKPFELR